MPKNFDRPSGVYTNPISYHAQLDDLSYTASHPDAIAAIDDGIAELRAAGPSREITFWCGHDPDRRTHLHTDLNGELRYGPRP
jgi:hypothetical protein